MGNARTMVFFYLFNKQITLHSNQDKGRQHQSPQLEVSKQITKNKQTKKTKQKNNRFVR